LGVGRCGGFFLLAFAVLHGLDLGEIRTWALSAGIGMPVPITREIVLKLDARLVKAFEVF